LLNLTFKIVAATLARFVVPVLTFVFKVATALLNFIRENKPFVMAFVLGAFSYGAEVGDQDILAIH